MNKTDAERHEDYNTAIAAILRGRRGELGMHNREIAELASMHEGTVTRLLLNQRAMTVTQMIALCRALRRDPAEVMAEGRQRSENSAL